ncbi:MAG: hypothetical protein ABI947_22980 [Chloroflexota bacterium]
MAIISESSNCMICGKTLNRPSFATWGVWLEPKHPLFRYCDAPFHIDCMANWTQRIEFSRSYFEMWRDVYRGSMGNLLIEQENWMLVTGPAGPHITPDMKADFAKILLDVSGRSEDTSEPFYAMVITANWPLRLRTEWLNWDAFVLGGYREHLVDGALLEASQIMTAVARIVPDLTTLRGLLAYHLRNMN